MLFNKIISSSTHFPANVMISFSIMTVQRVLTAELPKLIQSKNKKSHMSSDHTMGGGTWGKGKLLEGIAEEKMSPRKVLCEAPTGN